MGRSALLLGRGLLRLGVALLVALDTPTGVHQLLLPRVEGMAVVAELDVQLFAGASGHKRVAARAGHVRDLVLGVDALFHGNCLSDGTPIPTGVANGEGHQTSSPECRVAAT